MTDCPHKEVKTAHGHFDAPQQHLYNRLARPAAESVSTQERTRSHDSVLAYGYHNWLALRTSQCFTGQTTGRTDNKTDNIKT